MQPALRQLPDQNDHISGLERLNYFIDLSAINDQAELVDLVDNGFAQEVWTQKSSLILNHISNYEDLILDLIESGLYCEIWRSVKDKVSQNISDFENIICGLAENLIAREVWEFIKPTILKNPSIYNKILAAFADNSMALQIWQELTQTGPIEASLYNRLLFTLVDNGYGNLVWSYFGNKLFNDFEGNKNLICVLVPGNTEILNLIQSKQIDEISNPEILIAKIKSGNSENVFKLLESRHLLLDDQYLNVTICLAQNGFSDQIWNIYKLSDIAEPSDTHILLLAYLISLGKSNEVYQSYSKICLEQPERFSYLLYHFSRNGLGEEIYRTLKSSNFNFDSINLNLLNKNYLFEIKLPNIIGTKLDFINNLSNKQAELKLDKNDLVSDIVNRLRNMPLQVITLAIRIFEKSSLQQILDFAFSKKALLRIPKTHGELEVVALKNKIVFKHRINHSAFLAWQKVAESNFIPCAPIINHQTFGHITEVNSLFWGASIDQLNLESSNPLWLELNRQREVILAQLKQIGVDHLHPHLGNNVVRFFKRGLFANYLNSENQLILQPGLQSQVQFCSKEPENYTDNVEIYLQSPEKFVPVVSIIDFDLAKFV
ncbi:MAG: hypothetical protein OHK0017_07650 [Patescibacteria group bacterium]